MSFLRWRICQRHLTERRTWHSEKSGCLRERERERERWWIKVGKLGKWEEREGEGRGGEGREGGGEREGDKRGRGGQGAI